MFFRKYGLFFFIIITCITMYILLNNDDKLKKSAESTTFYSMDTFVTVTSPDDIFDITKTKFNEYDELLNCYNPNSEIAMLNEKGNLDCSNDTIKLIENTLVLNTRFDNTVDLSAGALTMLWNESRNLKTLPSENDILSAMKNIGHENIHIIGNKITLENDIKLDLSAVAKGYTLDIIKKIYDENNVEYAVVSTGSSVLLYGDKPNDEPFKVSIRNPENPSDTLGEVLIDGESFLSTSGGYERFFEINGEKYHHIIDISTGYPAKTDITSVTVFCDNGLMSDFLSTLIFISGKKSLKEHLNADDYKILVADTNNNIYISDGLNFDINEKIGYNLVKNYE